VEACRLEAVGVLADTPAPYLLEVDDIVEFFGANAVRIVDEAGRIGQRDDFAAEVPDMQTVLPCMLSALCSSMSCMK
jgi:hypothetical protein